MLRLHNFYFLLYLFTFFFLAIPALKLVDGVRVGQFFILTTFMFIFMDDFLKNKVQWKILLYFFVGAFIMSLISFNSLENKFGEIKFMIKYFLIFPAAYYVGYSTLLKLNPKRFIYLTEISIFIYAFFAYIIEYAPVPKSILDKFISYREGWGGIKYLDFQGTFFEAGWLAMVIGSMLLISLLLRFQFQLWPKKKSLLIIFYIFIVVTLVLSKNKTVWIAFILILLFMVFYKSMLMLLYSNKYQPNYMRYKHALLMMYHKVDTLKVLMGVLLFIVLFFILNSSLNEPLISAEMLQEKLEKERGKVFMIVSSMLEESHYFGGYGFGFVEAYFTLKPQDVIGLGEGSAMVFNSYLDIWLSTSIFGLIFHLGLVYLSMNKAYYLSFSLPIYYFIFANFNPATGDEFYYLFLGFSLGVATYLSNEKKREYV